MNLAFCLFKFFPYGGLERSFLRIAQSCADRGHSVHIYTMRWEGDKPSNFEVTIIPVKHWSNHGKNEIFVKKLTLILGQQKHDVVIGFNRMPGLDLYYGADPCYIEKINRTKSPLFKLTNRFKHFSRCEKAIFEPSSKTKLLMLTKVEKKKYIDHYHTQPERFYILPAGIGLDRKRPADAGQIRKQWRAEFNFQDDEKIILMIGSAFKRKGLGRTLLGLASLPTEIKSKTHIVMVGADNPKPFQAKAKQLGLSEQLHIFQGRDDVPRFLLAADLFVHPAFSETAGNVILEAMLAGLPVLVSEICGFSYHVKKSNTGLITPEPFAQANFNQQLSEMLTSKLYPTWVKNCIHYSETEDLYSRPEAVADIIDSFKISHASH